MAKQETANVHVLDGGDGVPPEPDWALVWVEEDDQHRAREHWRQVVSALRDAGALAVANGHAIERLVRFRMAFEASANDVAENGVQIPGTKRKEPRANPHLRYMRSIDESIRQLEAELCIAPLRRSRAGKVPQKAKVARGRDAYLHTIANSNRKAKP